MESKGLVIASSMILVLLFTAGHCQSDGYYKGYKKCDPLCFGKCAFGGGDIKCFGNCLMACLFPPTGQPDRNNPQAICLASCVVPRCAKLSTPAHPFSKEVEHCLESCADDCADKKIHK